MSQTVSSRLAAPGFDPAPYHGSQNELRDFVAECMERTRFYSTMSVDYAIANDDVGLEYSIRCAVASLKQGASVLKMLKEKKAKTSQERQIARATHEGAAAALGL